MTSPLQNEVTMVTSNEERVLGDSQVKSVSLFPTHEESYYRAKDDLVEAFSTFRPPMSIPTTFHWEAFEFESSFMHENSKLRRKKITEIIHFFDFFTYCFGELALLNLAFWSFGIGSPYPFLRGLIASAISALLLSTYYELHRRTRLSIEADGQELMLMGAFYTEKIGGVESPTSVDSVTTREFLPDLGQVQKMEKWWIDNGIVNPGIDYMNQSMSVSNRANFASRSETPIPRNRALSDPEEYYPRSNVTSTLPFQSGILPETSFFAEVIRTKLGNSEQVNYFIHVGETLFITARMLQTATCKGDVLFAFGNMAKHHLPERALLTSTNLHKVSKLINTLFTREMELQSGADDVIFALRNLLTDYKRVQKSPMFKKVFRLFSYFVALEIFEKAGVPLEMTGYTVLEKELLRKKYHLGPDFVYSLLDTTLFLCERGIQCWKTGALEPIFHSGNTHAEWYDKTMELKRQSKLLHNPALMETSEAQFLHDLDAAIENGSSIYKFASRLSDYDRRQVNEKLNDLLMIKSEILCLRFANESRQVPFSVLVYGESGIGKSTVKDMLYYLFCQVRGLPNDSEYKYVRNPVSEFWDGFRSSMHSLVLDDVAFMSPNYSPNGDKSCLEFLQVINPVPFVPNQAALEHKGRTPFRCQFVIATTNTRNLNAHHYFSHPSAVQRRFPFIITPHPKDDYVTDGQLDSSKVPPPQPGTYPDLWTFSVSKVVTVPVKGPSKEAGIIPVLEKADQKTFFEWYVGAIKNHFINQTKMTDSIELMSNVKSCGTCFLPTDMCECKLQSLFVLASISVLLDNFFRMAVFYRFFLWWLRILDIPNGGRRYFYDLGRRVENTIQSPRFLAVFAGVVAGAMAIWKLKAIVPEFQASKGIVPVGKDEKPNPWYRNDFELTNFDVTRQTLSWKTLDREKLVRTIQANTMSLEQKFLDNGVTLRTFGHALALEGHKIMVNLHTLRLDVGDLNLRLIRQSSSSGVTTNISFKMKTQDIQIFPEHDIAILTVYQLPPFRRITTLFPKASFEGGGKGFIVLKQLDGKSNTRDFVRAKLTKNVDFSHYGGLIHDIYTVEVPQPTENGDCGAPYVLTTPQGPVILGIHVTGYEGVAQCLFFDQDTIKKFVGERQIVSGLPELSSKSSERRVAELAPKSVFRYIQSGSATVYGSFTGFKMAPKTRVELTPMNSFLQERGYSTKYTKPIMAGWQPWRVAALDLVNPVVDIDLLTLDTITDQFSETILRQLTPEDLKKLAVYDDFTALNGAAGIAYVDKMNRNTSAGNPWKKSKKHFLTAVEPRGDNLEPVEASEEIMDRMRDIMERYKCGERAHPNFCAHLKDEPVTHEKRAMGKTRVFSGAPFDWSLVVRKYFLSSIRVIQSNSFVFEAAPGTICQSSEWGEIYNFLVSFGEDRIVAGDYKAYDKRMPPAFILAAFDVLITICKASKNFDDEDIMIMKGIAIDTAYPLTDFNGDLVEFYGSNPSGHPLTVIINSVVNSLYMRYVYYIMNPKHEVLTFKENVKLMTYGDDNIMGVSPDVPWFNHTTIQRTLASIGITYTMPDKTSESVPYISIANASFLKRTWRFDTELQEYLCPLEHESIERSLMVWVRSKTICWEEQAMQVMSSAAQEYFFYGRKTYDKRVLLLMELIEHLGIESYIMYDKHGNSITFPKYESLVEKFRAAGR